MSKFVATNNKGFQMVFENGFRISVLWGGGNYCQRKEDGEYSEPMKTEFWESTSSEIAVFNKDGEFITITNYPDVVAGWLNTDKVAKVITVVQSATTKEEIETKLKALNI